jgi:cytochrome c553
MPQLVEMDRHVSLFEQMEEQVGSVVLINTFTVEPEEADQLQEAWASDAATASPLRPLLCNSLDQKTGKVTQRPTETLVERLPACVGCHHRPSSRQEGERPAARLRTPEALREIQQYFQVHRQTTPSPVARC